MNNNDIQNKEQTNIKESRMPPKAACVHDLAGFGRCSFSVILPTLACMGVQPCAIPTAVLSTHTGGFTGFTFLDFTEHIEDYYKHWIELDVKFDAFYSGFLGSFRQIELVEDMIKGFGYPKTILVDPVMGDDGSLYSTYTEEMQNGMKALVKMATVITPNITEASFLLDIPCRDYSLSEKDKLFDIAKRLGEFGPDMITVTGINSTNSVATVCYDKKRGEPVIMENERVPKSYPGTGDIFASVLLGELLRDRSLEQSCEKACSFVHDVIEYSRRFDYPVREGVLLESLLYKLL
ncbi:MAG: pyridoxamine kinase [Ruminococcaceae bacterium]|nr:pyridoxamine kinase [Oscillospiraceae bacterium]